MSKFKKALKHAVKIGTPFTGGFLSDSSVRKRLSLTGKQVKSRLFPNSAGAYNVWSGDVYGHTGSIVGRY